MKKSLVCGIMGAVAVVSVANALPSVEAVDLCKTYPDKYVYTTSTNGSTKCIPINPCDSEKYRDMYCVEVPVPVFVGAGFTGIDIFFKKYIQTHYNNTSVVNNRHHFETCYYKYSEAEKCEFNDKYYEYGPRKVVVGYKLSDGRYVAFEFTDLVYNPSEIYRETNYNYDNGDFQEGTMCWAWKDCYRWDATKCSKYADFRSLVTEDNCNGEMSMNGKCIVTCEKAGD